MEHRGHSREGEPVNGFVLPSLRKVMFWLFIIMVASLLIGILIAVVDNHPCGQGFLPGGEERKGSWADVSVPSGPARQVKIDLDISSGDISLSGDETPGMVNGRVICSHEKNPPHLTSTVVDGVGKIGIERPSGIVYDILPGKEDWNLTLNRTLPAELRVSINKGDILLNTSDTCLNSVYLESGAGDIVLNESRWSGRRQSVHIESGVGDITALFPEQSRVSVTLDKGIGNNNLFGFDEYKSGYTHHASVRDAPKIDLTISQGIGNVTLRTVP
ncbi:MAG: toast rack family protein [Methanospirillum sp.]|nr:toast rack family protein [Methanospirillum sp.]